ncbi:MAG TPA: RrF2 family transcriptional regulator [Firmicutes bacterium]|nr:RrF2 family transcriptional regulator [Bacillota bacterium]
MKLSSRSRYGVRALCALAILSRDNSPVPLARISKCEGIPKQYLGLIFHKLRKSGHVEAVRGLNGGYKLAKSPAEITVASVVRALDGPIAPVKCLIEREKGHRYCWREEVCLSRPAWAFLQQQIEKTLESITIESLIKKKCPTET